MTLDELIKKAKENRPLRELQEEERKEQAISFAYGNVKLRNPSLTRKQIEEEAIKIYGESALGD